MHLFVKRIQCTSKLLQAIITSASLCLPLMESMYDDQKYLFHLLVKYLMIHNVASRVGVSYSPPMMWNSEPDPDDRLALRWSDNLQTTSDIVSVIAVSVTRL